MLDNGDGDGDDNIWVVSSETGVNMFVVVGVFLRNKKSYFCHRDKRRQILEHFKKPWAFPFYTIIASISHSFNSQNGFLNSQFLKYLSGFDNY